MATAVIVSEGASVLSEEQEQQKQLQQFLTARRETDAEAVRLCLRLSHGRPSSQQPLSLFLPELNSLFPQSPAEVEVQQFNLRGVLPSARLSVSVSPSAALSQSQSQFESLSTSSVSVPVSAHVPVPVPASISEEDLAMWFLEKDSLRRDRVALFLSQPTLQARGTLGRLLDKVCGLEIAQGFVEGLKFFLLVSGLWDLCICSPAMPSLLDCEEQYGLHSVLMLYIQAHFALSKKSLFPLTSVNEQQMNICLEIALVVMETCRTLHGQRGGMPTKSINNALSEFCNSLRHALKKPESGSVLSSGPALGPPSMVGGQALMLTAKTMTDMFNVISGPIVPLKVSPTAPSYLFGSIISNCSSVQVGYDYNYQDTLVSYHIKLCKDALYFFSDFASVADQSSYGNDNNSIVLVAVIPLKHIHPQRCSYNDNHQVIELFDLQGESVPWITYEGYSATIDGVVHNFPVPNSIETYERVFLDFKSANQTIMKIEDWIDQLENSCWECRPHSNL